MTTLNEVIMLYPNSDSEEEIRELFQETAIAFNNSEGKPLFYLMLPNRQGSKMDLITVQLAQQQEGQADHYELVRSDFTASWQEVFTLINYANPALVEAVQRDIVDFLGNLEDQQRLAFFPGFEVNARLGNSNYRVSVDNEGKLKVI